ncbi:MAG: site-2 protease family protein [Thermoleophilia bacterium]
MSDAAPRCFRHPGTETLLSCARCGQPACPDCLVPSAVGFHCVDCVRSQRGERTHAARSVRRLTRPDPIFLLLVAGFVGTCVWAAATPVSHMFMGASQRLGPILLVIVGWVVSLCLHEFAHAFVAWKAGDTSIPDKGYLTLDPLKYTDPVWSLVVPVLMLAAGGIGLPGGAVWIEQHRIRSRAMRSMVSLAGPATNIVFGAVCVTLVHIGAFDSHPTLMATMAFLGKLEFVTALLNLLPVPGLDGYGAISPYLPADVRHAIAPWAQYGVVILFLVMLRTGFGNELWTAGQAMVDIIGVPDHATDAGELLSRLRLL